MWMQEPVAISDVMEGEMQFGWQEPMLEGMERDMQVGWAQESAGAEGIDAAARVRQRQKQVALGKLTVGYANYVSVVPKESRDPRVHIATPPSSPRSNHVSKRKWERQLRCWRQFLHQYDFAGPYVPSSELSDTYCPSDIVDTPERSFMHSLSGISGSESYDSDSHGLSASPRHDSYSTPPLPPSCPPSPPPIPTNDVWNGLVCSCLSDNGAVVRIEPNENAPVLRVIPQGEKVLMLGAVNYGGDIWGRVGAEEWCRIVSKDGISFYPAPTDDKENCVVLEGLCPVEDSIQWCVECDSSPRSDLEMMSAYIS